MIKNQGLTFSAARSYDSKYKNLISEPTLSAYMSACQYLPMDFYCLSEGVPYALSKTIKIAMEYCLHFFYKATDIQYFRKLVVLKNP